MPRPPISVRHPKFVLLAWVFVIAVMGFALAVYPQIDINPTYKSMIMKDDPDASFDTNVKNVLGDDEIIVLAIENEKTIFDIPTLQYIDKLTTAIEKLPTVRKVYSPTRADDIRGRAGSLVADDLITQLPKTQADLDRIEKEAFENPMYAGMILMPDKKVASINVELKAGHTTKEDAETSVAIYKIVDDAEGMKPAGVHCRISGFPIASYLGGSYMISDMVVFCAASMALLVVIMLYVLRSWHGVFFTMFVTMASVSMTYGVMSILGIKITMPLSSIMAFMTAIGMEYSVYVAFAYQHAVQTGPVGRHKNLALTEAFVDVKFTVVMSAACAATAFGSMLTHPVLDLKLLGIFLGFGTLICCFAALTIIPAWISLWTFPVPPKDRISHRRLQNLLDWIGRMDTMKPWKVIGVLVVLIGVGSVLMTQMSADSDAFQWFKKSSTIYKDDMFIRDRMAGDTFMPVIVTAKEIDAFKDPANLAKLDDVARYARTLPHVTKTITHADHIKLMNEALHSGTPADYKLPDTKAAVEQYLLLHNEPDDFHLWIDPDYKMANVMVRLDSMSSTVLLDTETKLEAYIAKTFPAGFTGNAVGTTLLVHRAFNTMAVTTLTGLVTAALFILVIMIIGFRSVRIGLISLLPTLPPALMVYATLPLLGHPLDPPTSVTGAIALGIAIDDTTWFFRTWIAARRQPGIDNTTAIKQTLTAIGRPMVLSSFVLGSGFAIMLLSRYKVLLWLGVMMMIVAFWSIFWDIFGTPTVVRLFDPKLPRERSANGSAQPTPPP